MKIVRLSCPDCGAPLEADADKDIFFCGYCGRKIILDQENSEKEFTFKNACQNKVFIAKITGLIYDVIGKESKKFASARREILWISQQCPVKVR